MHDPSPSLLKKCMARFLLAKEVGTTLQRAATRNR